MNNLRQGLLAVLWLSIVALLLVSLTSFLLWRRDLREIRQIVAGHIQADAPKDEIVEAARRFIEHEVGYGRSDSYFLSPLFRFMRPTALQVIQEGGDCAYRTRAFIVILNQFDIEASKRAIYNDEGRPVHAVAEISTDRGPYYVDALYNVAHEDMNGEPLSLAQLSHVDTLRMSIERAVAGGNERAAQYPFDEYSFGDVRTINWNKNVVLEAAYTLLVAIVGEQKAKAIPRPYLSEEPALMVIVICTTSSLFLLLLVWQLSRSRKRRAPHTVQT